MMTSEKVDKILPALFKVKQNLTTVKKSTKNPFFKSSYADLNTHLDAVEPLLEENGLLILQPTCHDVSGNTVVTRIYHVESGQFVEASMKLVGDNDMQKSGSGVTYARRYTLGSLLSMQAVDDDGNDVTGRLSQSKAASTTKETKPVEPKSETSKTERPSFRNRPKSSTESSVEPTGDDL